MSLSPDAPSAPPSKPKLTPQERRTQKKDQLESIRLRMIIWHALDNRSITRSAEISTAIGLAEPDAVELLKRKLWWKGDVALLEAVAMRLEMYSAKAGW